MLKTKTLNSTNPHQITKLSHLFQHSYQRGFPHLWKSESDIIRHRMNETDSHFFTPEEDKNERIAQKRYSIHLWEIALLSARTDSERKEISQEITRLEEKIVFIRNE